MRKDVTMTCRVEGNNPTLFAKQIEHEYRLTCTNMHYVGDANKYEFVFTGGLWGIIRLTKDVVVCAIEQSKHS